MTTAPDVFTQPPIPTGLAPLDAALGGGLRHGGFVVVCGGTGAGKSTLALALVRGIARRTRWLTWGETAHVVLGRANQHGVALGVSASSGVLAGPTDLDVEAAFAVEPRVVVVLDGLRGAALAHAAHQAARTGATAVFAPAYEALADVPNWVLYRAAATLEIQIDKGVARGRTLTVRQQLHARPTEIALRMTEKGLSAL